MAIVHQINDILIKLFLFICLSWAIGYHSYAQLRTVLTPVGGGVIDASSLVHDELSAEQRTTIIGRLQHNIDQLRAAGKLPEANQRAASTLFDWPIRQTFGFYDNGFFGVSNYVDHNTAFPNQKLDYNCGSRTYDLTTGYNHQGTDIYLWPFYWSKMNQNAVEVVAAAPGVILDKFDGNADQNCSYCPTCNWNAIYIMHNDGTVAWYGHLKKNSITSKAIGQTVSSGEFLANVGSSGNSTGPHLHFEVYTNSSFSQLIDPWAGNCNSLNGLTSWWKNQQSYYNSTLNKIMTHGVAPVISTCPTGEAINEKVNFINGDTVILAGYYRDQQLGQTATHTVYLPDNTVYQTWTQNFTLTYTASYWLYNMVLPSTAPSGMWRYEIDYLGQVLSTPFSVNSAPYTLCDGASTSFVSNITGSTYQWQVNTGSGFVNLNNNFYYNGVQTKTLQLNQPITNFYGYQYRCLVNGVNYSNVLTLQFSSRWNGSVSEAWEEPLNWDCRTVPDAQTDVIIKAGKPRYPVVRSNASCRSTRLDPNTSLEVQTGFNLHITGKN